MRQIFSTMFKGFPVRYLFAEVTGMCIGSMMALLTHGNISSYPTADFFFGLFAGILVGMGIGIYRRSPKNILKHGMEN